jgi:hypothetical protein
MLYQDKKENHPTLMLENQNKKRIEIYSIFCLEYNFNLFN